MNAYSLRDAARIVGISPARLRQWERSDLVRPGLAGPDGPAFGFRDLVCLKAILALLEHGVPLRRIRRTVHAVRERIPEVDEPVRSLRVWLEGSARVVVRHGGALYEANGQMVIDFPLSPARDDDVTPLAARRAGPGRDPATALEWFERGCRLDGRAETLGEAEEAYRRSLACDPEFADAHCNLGAVHHQRDRRAAARECYQRALACDPEHVEAHLNLASLLEEEGRHAPALRHVRAALRADPLRADAHLGAALLYERLGLRRRAREHWRRYLQVAPAGAWADVARQRLEETG